MYPSPHVPVIESIKRESFFLKPQNVILLFMGLILTFTTIAPVVALVYDTLSVHPGTVDAYLAKRPFGYTFANYVDLFNGRLALANLWQPLFNTLFLAIGACIVALLVGGFAACFIFQSDMPCKKYIGAVFILPSFLPHWTLSVVWSRIFNSNLVTNTPDGILASLFNIHMPYWWCRGLFPCIIVIGITYAPFAFMLIGSSLRSVDADLIKSALTFGTPRWKIFWRVILPLSIPAVLSTVLVVCDSAMGSYPVPHYLEFTTLSTRYMAMTARYTGEARILMLILIFAGIVINVPIGRAIRKSSRRVSSGTTKKQRSSFVMHLGIWKKFVITTFLLCYTFLTSLLPILVMALETFLPNPGDYSFLETFSTDSLKSLSTLTTKWWLASEHNAAIGMSSQLGIFFNSTIGGALLGTIWVALCVALLSDIFGTLLGYIVTKQRTSRVARYVNAMASLSSYMPSFALGAAFFVLTSNNYINLFNTYTLLIIVGTVKYTPFVSRSVQDSMHRLSFEIEDAAILFNIPWTKRMTRIILPLQRGALTNNYFLPFTECLRELNLFMLLCLQTTILPTMVNYFDDVGHFALSSGIDLILIAVIVVSQFILKKITGNK